MRSFIASTRATRTLAACTLTAGLAFGGCQRIGTKVTEEHMRAYPKGVATYQQIVERFGPPTSATTHDDGTRQVIYDYSQSQVDPKSFIPVAGPFLRRSSGERTQTVLEFDATGILRVTTFTYGQTEIGTGFSTGGRQQ